MKITLRVTQQHIDNGVLNDCHKCPVAQAMRGIISPLYEVRVDARRLRIRKGTIQVWNVLPPPQIQTFIINFDNPTDGDDSRDCVEPFKCELDIPQELLKA